MTDDDVKEYAMGTPEASIHILVDKHDDAGVVMFDASTPAGVSYYQHMVSSFLQAVETALAFTQTEGLNEWIVCGPIGLTYVRSHPNYSEIGTVQERLDSGLVRVGRLHSKTVYAMRSLEKADMIVGHYGGCKCCRLFVQNGAFGQGRA